MKSIFPLIVFTSVIVSLGCGEQQSGSETSEPTPASSVRDSEATVSPVSGTAGAEGEVMPEYSASDLRGGTWRLAEEDGVTMLNLWATWCGPCRYEIPALIQLQREYGEQGLQVVGVSMDRPGMEAQINAYAKAAGINYRIVHDPQARLADVFETTIIPTTALIDRDGKIVWFHAGIVREDDPEMLEALKAALPGKRASTAAGS